MATRFNASGEAFTLSSGVLSYNAAYTWSAWVFITVTNAWEGIMVIGTNNSAVRPVDFVGHNDGGQWAVGANTDSTYQNIESGTVTTGWHHLAFVRTSTTASVLYVDGVSTVTNNNSVAGRTAATRIDIGRSSSSNGDAFNGRVAHVKMWDTNLTAAEVAAEMRTIRPQRLANLWGWWPVFDGATERARDYSGNGRNWTESGTLTDEAEPGIPWGASPLLVGYAASGGPTQVGQDAQLAYHVRAAVNDTMALGWHTRAPVGKESAQAWHVRTPVGDDAPFGWHARALAAQSGQLAYHLRALATDDVALAFHARSLVADVSALGWHVRGLAADEVTLAHHLRALVADDAALGWHTRAVAAKTAQIAHHIRALAAATAQLTSHARAVAGAQSGIGWHLRSLVADDVALAWHLRALVADTIGLGWHVAGAPGVVGADLALAWHLRTTAQQDGALGWHDRVAIGDDAALAWALRSLVADQVALGWHLRGMVSDDAALGWRVAVQSLVAGADLPLGWHARKAITTAAALGWHLAAQSGGIAAGSSVLGAAISGGATRTSIGGGQAGATLTQGAMRGRWD